MLQKKIKKENSNKNFLSGSFLFFKKNIYGAVFILLFFAISYSFGLAQIDPIQIRELQLRTELAQIEKELQEQRRILSEQRQESSSLERDVAILNAQIEEAKLNIRAKNIAIAAISEDIDLTTRNINELDETIEKGKNSLAQLIRKTNDMDSFSLVEIVLSGENLSSFLIDLDNFSTIKNSMHALFYEIRDSKNQNEKQKQVLGVRRSEELDARQAIEAERRTIEIKENERRNLLAASRNEERAYEEIIRDREQRAAQIRSALFALRDSAPIPFGTALQYANEVQKTTGVRPAFLLSIITQESNLGANVGTCNRPQDTKKYYDIMPGPADKASREARGLNGRDDQTVYIRLMQELGLDHTIQPLSCDMPGGWGGAMGPAQFIPTTWAMYQDRIARATGKAVPNPWDPKDAFTASALFLADLGASNGGYSAEREAALRYYAGGNWNAPQNAFYGNQVMDRAQRIQEDINLLQGI